MERMERLRELLAKHYAPNEIEQMLEVRNRSLEISQDDPLARAISAKMNESFHKAESNKLENKLVEHHSALDWNMSWISQHWGRKSGFLSQLFKSKKPTRAELIRQLANRLVISDVLPPPEFVDQLVLAEAQTKDHALAEWNAVVTSATAYALWASLGSEEKVFPILKVYQRMFVESLGLSRSEFFLTIAKVREEDYVKRTFSALKSKVDAKALTLATSMASRIMGYYSDEELDEVAGFQVFTRTDPIAAAGLWSLIIDRIIAKKQYLDMLQQEVPALFFGALI